MCLALTSDHCDHCEWSGDGVKREGARGSEREGERETGREGERERQGEGESQGGGEGGRDEDHERTTSNNSVQSLYKR